MTGLETPVDIVISTSKDTETFESFDLGKIDVESTESPRRYVFCVRSNTPNFETFSVTLAYTTNIGFSYTLYHAAPDDGGDVTYLGSNYRMGAAVEGEFLNPDGEDPTLGEGDPEDRYFKSTYGEYREVQKYGVPLYWKTTERMTVTVEEIDGHPVSYHYFILEVSWEDDTLFNRKETDMLYIKASSE